MPATLLLLFRLSKRGVALVVVVGWWVHSLHTLNGVIHLKRLPVIPTFALDFKGICLIVSLDIYIQNELYVYLGESKSIVVAKT